RHPQASSCLAKDSQTTKLYAPAAMNPSSSTAHESAPLTCQPHSHSAIRISNNHSAASSNTLTAFDSVLSTKGNAAYDAHGRPMAKGIQAMEYLMICEMAWIDSGCYQNQTRAAPEATTQMAVTTFPPTYFPTLASITTETSQRATGKVPVPQAEQSYAQYSS